MNERAHRGRIAAIVLVALASLLAYLAVLSIWVDRQVLSTDNWARASSQMLENPTVRTRVAEYLVDELYANVDVEADLREALPDRAEPLAGPAAGALRSFAERAANEVLSRPRAQQAWENANRGAHELLLEVLEGGGPILATTGGAVVLDLRALLLELEARTGVGGGLADRLPEDAAQVTVLRSDELDSAQTALNVLDALPIVSVTLSLILFAGALLIAPGWRRRAVRAYGFGLVAAGTAALATGSLAGDAVVGSLVQTEAGEPAAREVWTIATRLLEQAAYAGIGYGALLIVGAWLAGPTRYAVALRRVLAPYLREPAIAYGGFAAVAAAVVLWWAPTPATRNPVTALALVVLVGFGFEGLRRRTRREFPDADRAAFEQRTRERLGGLYRSARARTAGGGAAVVRQARVAGHGTGGNGMTTEAPDGGRVEQLERLARLRDAGVLDEEEFRAEKARILAAPVTPLPS